MPTYHPAVSQILNLIKKNNLWHETFEHQPVTTSQEASKIRTGYSISQGAKAIILRIKGGNKYFAQFIIPGDAKINSKKLTKLLGAKSIRFATADEISELTNGIEIGGIPPFGNLFKLPVYIDPALLENNSQSDSDKKIIFNAGDRRFSIALKIKDYLELVKPEILSFVQ